MIRFLIFCLALTFAGLSARAQSDSTLYNFGDFGGIIYLDSLVVTASRQGFDVPDFIRMVREDQTFYQAFRNLRFLSYSSENSIELYDKKDRPKASFQSTIRQQAEGLCRSMEVREEQTTGNFYKRKKKYRYYTAKLYDRLFFTHQPTCEKSRESREDPGAKGMDKHVRELKKLIFRPGSKADVPLIGNRTAIFDPAMSPYYDFRIQSRAYKGGIDCYVFTAEVKEEFQIRKKGKTVIKFLETYFDKNTFQVIARNYRLAYRGTLFDFDVQMEIELRQLGGQYAPEYIRYDGFWNIPGRKPEIAQFDIRFYEFE